MGLHPSITNDPTATLVPYLHIPGFTGTSAQRIAYSTSYQNNLTYSVQWADTDTGKTWQWGTTSAVGWQQFTIGTSSMSVSPSSITGGTSGQIIMSGPSNIPAWTSLTIPTVQKFLSGSGTYTTPTSPRIPIYLRVRAVGGGAGGWGGGSSQGTASTSGASSTFGTSLISANGGQIASAYNLNGGIGGNASLGIGPVGLALTGGSGNAGNFVIVVGNYVAGGGGGNSAFGGGASGSSYSTGGAGATNTGAGGGGGGNSGTANGESGAGGGAGGFVDAIISSPVPTYSYSVGSGGNGGGVGTGGTAGGAGGSGIIIVEEFYQ